MDVTIISIKFPGIFPISNSLHVVFINYIHIPEIQIFS